LWSATATERGSKAYLDHFNHAVLPELRKLEGYAGSTVLTRETDGEVEILVATVWSSLQAIGQFAAADLESAVVAAEAEGILTCYDRRVRHFDVALTDEAAKIPY
jgi:heme-degrading monooxygenase HmoA